MMANLENTRDRGYLGIAIVAGFVTLLVLIILGIWAIV